MVLSSIAKRATVATKGAARRLVSPKCWNGGRGGSAASGVSATLQVHSRSFTVYCIHSSLLRRGATEPPDSHSPPLYVLHVLHGHPLCALNPSIPQSPTLPLPYLFAIPPIQKRYRLEMPVSRIENSPTGHCLRSNPDVVCRNHSSTLAQLVENTGI